MKRSKSQGMAEIKVVVSREVIAALDDYARAQGLSRADAVRVALYSAPQIVRAVGHGPVASRDVLGP